MIREERIKLAIEKGYTYNPESGVIYTPNKKEITYKDKYGYIILRLLNNKYYKLFGHQFAWYYVNKECVDYLDHINGIKDDNRINNLRSITNQENQWNQKKAKGYSWDKQRNKWASRITVNKKIIHLGRFDTEEEARQSYLNAKEKYHIIKT